MRCVVDRTDMVLMCLAIAGFLLVPPFSIYYNKQRDRRSRRWRMTVSAVYVAVVIVVWIIAAVISLTG